jgi:hypothetical protein
LKPIEQRLRQDRTATVTPAIQASGPAENEIRTWLENDGFHIRSCSYSGSHLADERE